MKKSYLFNFVDDSNPKYPLSVSVLDNTIEEAIENAKRFIPGKELRLTDVSEEENDEAQTLPTYYFSSTMNYEDSNRKSISVFAPTEKEAEAKAKKILGPSSLYLASASMRPREKTNGVIQYGGIAHKKEYPEWDINIFVEGKDYEEAMQLTQSLIPDCQVIFTNVYID